MKKRNINKQHKNISIVNEMKSINKRLRKIKYEVKLKHYKNIKKEIKSMIFI
jgi:uncharacterized protein YerC